MTTNHISNFALNCSLETVMKIYNIVASGSFSPKVIKDLKTN